MSRVDVPTLRCDRCKQTTQDLAAMGRYRELVHLQFGVIPHPEVRWDLCPECWDRAIVFLDGGDA